VSFLSTERDPAAQRKLRMTLQSALREPPPDPTASSDTYETTRTFEYLGIGVELT